jgi:hypothetical protein
MRFLGSVRPPRLLVHADRVWEGQSTGGNGRAVVVDSVEGAGTGVIASLSTSTGTYIAAGFAMHNTAMEAAFTAASQAVVTALLAQEKAVTKAEVATEKRLEGLNEFRQQLAEIIATLMPRGEFTSEVRRLTERMTELQAALSTALSSSVSRVEADVMQRQIQQLADRASRSETNATGLVDARTQRRADSGQVLLAVSVVLAAVAIVVTLVISRGI